MHTHCTNSDWLIVTCFYVALQATKAHLLLYSGIETQTHPEIATYLKREKRFFREAYNDLHSMSETARYEIGNPQAPVIHNAKHVAQALGLLKKVHDEIALKHRPILTPFIS